MCDVCAADCLVFTVEPYDEVDADGPQYLVRQVVFEELFPPRLGHTVAELHDLDAAGLYAVLDALVPAGHGFEAHYHGSSSPFLEFDPRNVLHVVCRDER
jgi:hypothetical protein